MGELQRTAHAPAGEEDAPSIGRIDDAPSIVRIDALVLRNLGASVEERERLGEELNTLLLRLPSEPQREPSAALLRRLLDGGALAGLGTEKMPASIAATKALLDLGYPSALEVDPQHLEALRRWEHERARVPWLTILVTLFVVIIVQIAVVTMGADGYSSRDPVWFSPDVVAGKAQPRPFWMEDYIAYAKGLVLPVLGLQFVAEFTAFFFTVVFARWPSGRVLARRAFLLLSGLGTLVTVVLLPANPWMGLATFLPAVGAFISATLLKSR